VRHAPWLPVAFFIMLLFLMLLYLAGKRPPGRPRGDEAIDEAVAVMRDFLEAAESLGYSRGSSQTAGEYVDELCSSVPGLSLCGEVLLFEKARYGKRKLLAEELGRMREGLNEALRMIRRHPGGATIT
jgi:hypothetical protein